MIMSKTHARSTFARLSLNDCSNRNGTRLIGPNQIKNSPTKKWIFFKLHRKVNLRKFLIRTLDFQTFYIVKIGRSNRKPSVAKKKRERVWSTFKILLEICQIRVFKQTSYRDRKPKEPLVSFQSDLLSIQIQILNFKQKTLISKCRKNRKLAAPSRTKRRVFF